MRNPKFIVFGGAGFIGSHIVEALLDKHCEVIVVDNLSTGFESYIPKHKNCTFLKLDISDWNELSKNFSYFKGAIGVYHCAAVARIQPSIYAPHLTHDSNVTGTLNVLEMMRMCDISRIVYSASSSAYGLEPTLPSKETDPVSCQTPYAVTKYMGELYLDTWSKLYGISNIRLRYFNVWGPRSPEDGPYAPVISKFLVQASSSEPQITVVGDGQQRRDFTNIKDVVAANLEAMEYLWSADDETVSLLINIGTGTNHSILEVAQKVQNYFPAAEIIHIPERIGEAKLSLADNSLAKKILNWEPKVSFDDGLLQLVTWFRFQK